MSITFSGLATGLDTDSIITEIMALERAPIDRLEEKKTEEADRLEAFAQFKNKLDALKTAVGDMSLTSQVRSSMVSLSSDAVISAETTSAANGSYNISVAQLSQVQKTISDGFNSKSGAILGTGTITVNGTSISVDSDNNSLSEVMTAINAQSSTTGVTASIINDGSSADAYHLVFTGADASTTFTIETDLTDSSGTAVELNPTDVQQAQQAVAFIDGIKVVSDTNTITDAISGVTINLNGSSETSYAGTAEDGVDSWDWTDPPVYKTTSMTVEADTSALKEKITSFVTAYNGVMEWIASGYEDLFGTTTTTTTEDGTGEELLGSVLRGDATINTVKRQLQSVLTDIVDNSGGFTILSEIGISTNVDGTLTQNNTKLDSALSENYDDMVALLSGDDQANGVMKNFISLLLDLTSSADGVYANQKSAYDTAIDKLDSQIDLLEARMDKRETTLRNQFTAMEQLVSTLNAQGDYLTQQLAVWTNQD